MKRIGLLGGTFDPPHIGHLLMAEEARLSMNLDEVWWLPNRIPPHKEKRTNTSGQDRLDMVQAMTKLEGDFKLCDIELEMDGPSFTINTIKVLTAKFPDYKFFFIIGADSLLTLDSWHESERLKSLAKFIVIQRPGFEIAAEHLSESIIMVEGAVIDVSSTVIRKAISAKRLNQFLLTKNVNGIIKERRLYE